MRPQSDVHLIKGRASNLYLCSDDAGLALIDAGFPGDHGRVLARLRELGHEPAELTRMLVTHADIDHAGSLAVLQKETGATVYAGAQTAVLLQTGQTPQHLPAALQLLSNAVMKIKPVPAGTIAIVEDGDILPVLGGLQALATPGHTLDHFAFFGRARGILFAGDALNMFGGRLGRTPPLITADQNAADDSAVRLLQLAPAIIACGHGVPSDDHSVDDLTALFNQLRHG